MVCFTAKIQILLFQCKFSLSNLDKTHGSVHTSRPHHCHPEAPSPLAALASVSNASWIQPALTVPTVPQTPALFLLLGMWDARGNHSVILPYAQTCHCKGVNPRRNDPGPMEAGAKEFRSVSPPGLRGPQWDIGPGVYRVYQHLPHHWIDFAFFLV